MRVESQRFEFVPTGGDPHKPIRIIGFHDYSPRHSRKVDLWRFELPNGVQPAALNGMEAETWGAVLRILRSWFPNEADHSWAERIKAA